MDSDTITDQFSEATDGPQSLMERLRAARQEVAEAKETFISIPGYADKGFDLQAKYRLVEREEMEKIGRKVRKLTRDRGEYQVLILCDMIITACEGFYLGDQPLTFSDDGIDTKGERILTYDVLAEYLGRKVATAREGLYYVFGDNEFAIGSHGIKLSRWFQNTGVEVDDEFLGEA